MIKKCRYCDNTKKLPNKSWYICDNCKKTNKEYLKRVRETSKRRKKTTFKKYGTTNNFLSTNRNGSLKREDTCLEKFGVKSPLQNKKIHKKLEKTCLNKYGVDNVRKIPEVIEKIQSKRDMEKIIEKCKKTLKKRYGVEYTWHIPRWNPGYIDGRHILNRETKEGKKFFRGKFWKKITKEIKERDGYRCVECNTRHKRLNIHHKKPWVDILIKNNFDLEKTEKETNKPSNLETLCPRCHKTKDKEFIKIRKGEKV